MLNEFQSISSYKTERVVFNISMSMISFSIYMDLKEHKETKIVTKRECHVIHASVLNCQYSWFK